MKHRLRQVVVLLVLLLCVAVLVWVPWKGPEWGGAVLLAIAVAASVAYRVALVRRGLRRRRREIEGLCLS